MIEQQDRICVKCGRPMEQNNCIINNQKKCEHSAHCLCDNPAIPEEAEIVTSVGQWDFTKHCVERYWDRSQLKTPPLIETAWDESMPVGVSNKSSKPTYRWHPPTKILFVAWKSTVKTALYYSNTTQFNTDHLDYCSDCNMYYDPSAHDGCNWCLKSK